MKCLNFTRFGTVTMGLPWQCPPIQQYGLCTQMYTCLDKIQQPKSLSATCWLKLVSFLRNVTKNQFGNYVKRETWAQIKRTNKQWLNIDT